MVKFRTLLDKFEAYDDAEDCFYLINTNKIKKLGYSAEELLNLDVEIQKGKVKLKNVK